MISDMTAMQYQKKRLLLMYGSTVLDLRYRLKTATSRLTFPDASPFVHVLQYGRLVWYYPIAWVLLMKGLQVRFPLYSITSCQICLDTRSVIKLFNSTSEQTITSHLSMRMNLRQQSVVITATALLIKVIHN